MPATACSATARTAKAGGRDQQVFPPLWGAQSYNWGAGMHQVNNTAAHERPQDLRFTRSVADTRKKFHDSPDSPYGSTVNGHLLVSAPSKPAPLNR